MKFKDYTKKIKEENYDIPDVYNKVKPIAEQKEYITNKEQPKITFIKRPIFKLASLLIVVMLTLTVVLVISSRTKEEQYEEHKVLMVENQTNLEKILNDTKKYQARKTSSTKKGCANIKSTNAPAKDSATNGSVNSGNASGGDATGDKVTTDNSDTNNQVEGIYEADRVKYDDNYIYYLYYNEIVIYKLDDQITYFDTIEYFTMGSINAHSINMQLYKNKLIVYYSYNGNYNDKTNNNRPYTEIIIFDTLNNFNVVKRVSLTGTNLDTRLYNSNLYIITSEYISNVNMRPIVEDNQVEEEVKLSNVMYVRNCYNVGYTILSKIDLDNLELTKSVQLGASQYVTIYMSLNRIYLVSNIYSGRISASETTIYAYDVTNNKLEFEGYIVFTGKVLDQYSLDEYNGMLRVASTNTAHTDPLKYNSIHIYDLSILDESQVYKRIGLLEEGLGEEYQEIKSVKFDKTHASVVTYRNMDPLYDIDLTDPTNPKIIGKYKSPGYSSYLYKFNDDYMLGIGYNDSLYPKLSFYQKQNDTYAGMGKAFDFFIEERDGLYVEYAYSKPSELLFITVDGIMTFGIPVLVNEYTPTKYINRFEYWIFQIDLTDSNNPIKLKVRLNGEILESNMSLDYINSNPQYWNEYSYTTSTAKYAMLRAIYVNEQYVGISSQGIVVYDREFNYIYSSKRIKEE